MSDTVLNDNKTVDIKADLYNRYIKAFEGNSAALCELGHMYKYGYEIEQNYSKAFACYKLASDKGNVYAKQCLALMYYYGEGVKQDISKAKELYKKGFSGNNKEFQFFYSILGDSLFKPVLSDALEKNDLESQLEIAQFLYQQGYPQAYRKAFEWYMKAAEQGSPKAKYFLGNLYYNKKFENYDPLTAKKYLEASAENNVASAQYLLGKMYLNGDGVEKNYEKALEWFEKAAENRNEVARKNLPHYRNLLIPLAAAVKENTIDIIRKYIEEGNDVNKQYENDETLMMIAARYNSIEAAKVLYEAGAVIDAEAMTFSSTRVCYVNNKTPLMVAAIYNSIDVANFLISKGVNIDSKLVYSRETALSFAVKNNSKDVVELIISMGRVKIGGLLTKAVEANAYDIVKLLIREGAYCGKTVLNYAVSHGYVKITKLLIDAGADKIDTSTKNYFEKKNPTILEFYPADTNLFKKLLIERGQAKKIIIYSNGKTETKEWIVRSLSYHSNIVSNVMSSPLYKDAQQNGIIKIRFEIEDFDENRYREDEFRKNVEKGDPKALTELGDRYFSEKKFEQAFEVYKRAGNKKKIEEAAEFCNGEIQLQLAAAYENGSGVCKNSKKAFKWYELAAKQGILEAQKKSAFMYFTGKGCGQDLEKSFELFQKAAEQGDTDSQYQVAEFYYYEAGLKDSSRKEKNAAIL